MKTYVKLEWIEAKEFLDKPTDIFYDRSKNVYFIEKEVYDRVKENRN